jgi:ABC-2 type transport system permease protein
VSARVPSFGETVKASLSLALLRIRRGRALWFAAAIGLLVIVLTLAIRVSGHVAPRPLWEAVTAYPLRYVMVVLVPFLFCATALSEEVEARTITYLFVRPAPKSAVLLGKYLAGTAIAVALVSGTVAIVFVSAWIGAGAAIPWAELGRAAGGFALTSACYGAMFLFFGVIWVDAPYLLSLMYFGIVEIPLSLLPNIVHVASMSYHLTNLLGRTTHETNPVLATWNPVISMTVSAAVLGGVGLVFLLGATSMVTGAEYRFGKP